MLVGVDGERACRLTSAVTILSRIVAERLTTAFLSVLSRRPVLQKLSNKQTRADLNAKSRAALRPPVD
jgi:hypothetical protein